jgi:alkylhydroperoxidase family enzyme
MTAESERPRIDYKTVAPQAIEALSAVERYARGCTLAPALLELVKLRASMINGCLLRRHAYQKCACAGRI